MPATLSTPDFDSANAYPEVGLLRTALRDGDWPAVRALYDPMGWDGRALLVQEAADLPDAGDQLRRAVAADPADGAAAAMLGGHLIVAGWRVRTAAPARYVSREQWAGFHDHLRQAEAVLSAATAHDPGNLTAWQQRITAARGLQAGQAEARRRYERVAAIDPHHRATQSLYLQQLAPKWGGDRAAMHGFARERMLAAPDGAHNAVLVAEAHLEHVFIDGVRHLTTAPVRAELHEAAERSVWHPAFRRTPGWVVVLNHFAGAFAAAGEYAAAARVFRELGPHATDYPWNYLQRFLERFSRHPGRTFARFRRRALA
ncbi:MULTISPECIES: hypothetical protein [Catenuloplanes]|uniref:Tetratricopeptide (TPR) repeat protein n=1 Tax=Catenuloplanes niger TaxID=587534 RepID=A0AAE3ZR95_9ACTN|nr:hypothetical protein [Catenuloplanes niger]MDR7324181.1 tetratricopeptide (TPR) repeat protein [Catenuloplanes niger]